MVQDKYIPLVCVLLGRMAKLHQAEIRRHHRFSAYTGLCVSCRVRALNARSLFCAEREGL